MHGEIGDSGAVEKVQRLFHCREKQGQTRFSNCRKSSQSLFFAYLPEVDQAVLRKGTFFNSPTATYFSGPLFRCGA